MLRNDHNSSQIVLKIVDFERRTFATPSSHSAIVGPRVARRPYALLIGRQLCEVVVLIAVRHRLRFDGAAEREMIWTDALFVRRCSRTADSRWQMGDGDWRPRRKMLIIKSKAI